MAVASGLKSILKLAQTSKPLKRVMYTNQERSGQIGGSFKSIEGFDPELKRPIVGNDISNLKTPYLEIESPQGAMFRKDAKLMVDSDLGIDIPVGNNIKGSVTVKSNLIDSGNGSRWSWTKVPEGYENNTFIVAVEGPNNFTANGSHAYTLKTIYEKGGELSAYDKRLGQYKNMSLEKTEKLLEEKLSKAKTAKEKATIRRQLRGDAPHGRPTTKGVPEFGPIIGEIQMSGKKGKKHPVYEYIVMKKAGGSIVEKNPYD